ncbi:probable peptidoglycan muropeptide transporter SLC46 [Macrobrachium nipponense]|uniref:probable peptidoglycan muropeptide transporter SLC46 n=1 Tax=Macrobrachium nipponense TaxID=159736 RepID=UPI0030C7D7F2
MKPPATKHVKSASQVPPSKETEPPTRKWECPGGGGMANPALLWALWLKLKLVASFISLEPIMLLDGIAFSVIIVFVENLQMDKICTVNLNFTEEVCNDISQYQEENLLVQQSFSVFGMYNGIIMAFLPLFFILFMGAWSDKYGRKVPIVVATIGHLFWSLGYLVNSMVPSWPVEFLLLAALCDSLGGGTVSFITATNAYLSDVTSEESRTSRVGLANSIWFLGGPIGTLLGTYIYKYGGYQVLFGTAAAMYVLALTYLFFLPESHGPFAKKKKEASSDGDDTDVAPVPTVSFKLPAKIEDPTKEISMWKMAKDFFSYDRILDSFRCTFKARGGMVRAFIILLIFCNLLRRLGRGAYMYLFTRRVLAWKATDYGLWVTYKNFLAALGSLVMVPLLSTGMGISDNYLAILGASASILDYILYGLVSVDSYFLVWIAPCVALLVNSCSIAIRSMLSKFVTGDELGKVSAVMGALDGVMPMISFSLYTSVYHATVHTFPGAQFFFGASANILMTVFFIVIIMSTSTKSYSIDDLDGPTEGTDAVRPTALRLYDNDLRHRATLSPSDEKERKNTMRSSVILSGVNFHLGTPQPKKKLALPTHGKSMSTILIKAKEDQAHAENEISQQLQRKLAVLKAPPPAGRNGSLRGVDNLAYAETENGPQVKAGAEKNEQLEVILTVQELPANDRDETDSARLN